MGEQLGSRFTAIEQIGSGNYGSLFRVIDGEAATLTDRIKATKKLKDPVNHPHVLREASVQRRAQEWSPHIVKLFHVVPRDRMRAALVLEYAPLDLRTFLSSFYCNQTTSSLPMSHAKGGAGAVESASAPPTHLPLIYIRRIVRGLVEALHCLHARGIVHRDVKPENILVEPLGLARPLRSICPPLGFSQPTGEVNGCWVHAPHLPHSREAERFGQARHPPSALEPCQYFCNKSIQLHHELTGDELVSAIHRLHCEACRHRPPELTEEKEDPSCHQRGGCENESSNPCLQECPAGNVDGEGPVGVVANEEDRCSVSMRLPLSPDVKLCDFGSVRHIGTLRLRDEEEQRRELTPGPTTPVYCAPEMMLLQRYGTSVDMWAVGAILFEMLTGEFFLGHGILRSFGGDVVVQDDYCVIHRLNGMFRHLGTPSDDEWKCIAHPLYYPKAVLAQLPQVRGASLFRCILHSAPSVRPPLLPSRGDERKWNSETVEDQTGCNSKQIPFVYAPKQPAGVNTGRYAHDAATPAERSDEAAVGRPLSVSDFLFLHIGKSGVDFLRSLLRYDPSERMTSAEALRHPFLSVDILDK